MAGMYKVRLVSVLREVRDDLAGVGDMDEVVFEATPTFSENKMVEYTPFEPVHMPGAIQIYKGSKSRTFTITAPMISRTPDEAHNTLIKLQTLRSWTMPFFGVRSSTANRTRKSENNSITPQEGVTTTAIQNRAQQVDNSGGFELLGAPPEVLYLYAYSAGPQDEDNGLLYRKSRWVNINKVPVVLTSLDISYPSDVDYIPGDIDEQEPVPVKMEVTINLVETHSPLEFEKFDLFAFKRGELVYW